MSISKIRQLELLREFAVRGPSEEELTEFRESIKGLSEAEVAELMNEYAELMEADNSEGKLDEQLLVQMQGRVAEWNKHELARRTISMRAAYKWVAAAAIILVAGIGYWRWLDNKKQATTIAETVTIPPGKNGAILTLADGAAVLLDTISNATVALQEGVTTKVVNGALVYEGTGNKSSYNTMSTPKGRQYKLTLPDGSEVWLNAASSIRYPIAFTGRERKVELQGEAYFEVKKNARQPFVVDAGNKAQIEVLGTSFNVSAYSNEKDLNTTLIDGSIKVNGTMVKPGQQARITDKLHLINNADTEKVMAWQRGFFNFEGASLEEVMRQLERWYDIEVEYQNGIPAIAFGGEMKMNTSLNGILLALEKSGIHFRQEGRTLIVLPD
ncbi:FecR family protein [Pseudoflavitalea rhizosphaerae]|uniref:FecR family protein n=1 Tax=Pseudoflavitalea rhizosphaerae TaxID=1884793 RepID=UPI000F8F05EC|nr:FecR family protein [Pseudoflavitalea rhizosphaerae]